MLTKRTCIFLLLFLCIQTNISAQDKLTVKFGKIKSEDFEVTSTLIDSSTNAVVVADVGKSEFIANANEHTFSLVFTEKKRIKIINKNGFDAASITIPLYVADNGKAEKLGYLEAYTYNLEGGKVADTKVARSSVFAEKHNKNWVYNKFTFPALKEGSIIEYSYQVTSDFFFNLQPWTFQGEYPVLWSQYEADIPQFYQYVVLSQGYQPFFINKVDKIQRSFNFLDHTEDESFSGGHANSPHTTAFTVDGSVDYHNWVMRNVPALKEEPYTTTLRNSIVKIEFQLNQVVFPNSYPQNYMDSWEKVATDLMRNEDFGVPIERANNWLDKDVNSIVKEAGTDKERAEKIFEYVRDNFTCNKNNDIFITTGLKDVYKNKLGSVAEINLLLIAMLRNQKIEAVPVILSTRDHGFTHELYPLIDRYNYVIAKAVIDNKVYYLDATTPDLQFGKLPSEVYNGQAREITSELARPVYFSADSLRESVRTNVYIGADSGSVEGNVSHDFGEYESLRFREKSAKTVTTDFKKTLEEEFPADISIDNIRIDSLKLLDKPLGLKYDLKFKSFGDNNIVYFSPMLNEAIKKNPFAAAERFYPVEMPYATNNTYNLTMEIPKGYKVDELPKSVRVNLNENDGSFEYLAAVSGDYVQLRCTLILKKANFLNEDYQFLRDFYAFIVKKEAEQIVFKKIN